jgi:hypothetical protein
MMVLFFVTAVNCTLLRVETTFLAEVVLEECGFFTIARLAVTALAAGAASAADKARNPKIFNARLKICLDMMDSASLRLQ